MKVKPQEYLDEYGASGSVPLDLAMRMLSCNNEWFNIEDSEHNAVLRQHRLAASSRQLEQLRKYAALIPAMSDGELLALSESRFEPTRARLDELKSAAAAKRGELDKLIRESCKER